jgi:hypothetical protein
LYLVEDYMCPAIGLAVPDNDEKPPTGKCDADGERRQLLDGQTLDVLVLTWANKSSQGGMAFDEAQRRRPDLASGDWLGAGFKLGAAYMQAVMSE